MHRVARRTAVIRRIHQLHRTLGSVLAVMFMVWFASGAVMTFARYPQYTRRERLQRAPVIPANAMPALPAELGQFIAAGGLSSGTRVRLALLEDRLTWTVDSFAGVRRAWRASAPWNVPPLDESRARREAEKRIGARSEPPTRIDEADQWTIGRSAPGDYPLYRIAFADRAGSEVYLAANSGEILQQSTRSERSLAWLGPIMHWIYPCSLRRHAALWSDSVLCLAGLGLVLTGSGLFAGVLAARVRRRMSQVAHARHQHAYLGWHQRIGLWFGVFASSWLFSGALSLVPFDWSGGELGPAALAQLYAAGPADGSLPVAEALAHCSRELPVRELEIAAFAGTLVAVCSAADDQTRVVDLREQTLGLRRTLAPQRFARLGQALAQNASAFDVELRHAPDAYYYPTHAEPLIAQSYVRLSLHDRERTTLYIDASRAELLAYLTERKRLERWLFHGLHNLDVAPLYAHRWLWRGVIWSAMLSGFTLALLGLLMRLRRR